MKREKKILGLILITAALVIKPITTVEAADHTHTSKCYLEYHQHTEANGCYAECGTYIIIDDEYTWDESGNGGINGYSQSDCKGYRLKCSGCGKYFNVAYDTITVTASPDGSQVSQPYRVIISEYGEWNSNSGYSYDDFMNNVFQKPSLRKLGKTTHYTTRNICTKQRGWYYDYTGALVSTKYRDAYICDRVVTKLNAIK